MEWKRVDLAPLYSLDGTHNNPREQVKIIIKKKHLEPIGGKLFTTTIKKLVTHIRKWKLAIRTLFIFRFFLNSFPIRYNGYNDVRTTLKNFFFVYFNGGS